MANLSFDTKVLIEQVRCIEAQQSPDGLPETSEAVNFGEQPFEERLERRAQHLVKENDWQQAIRHAASKWRSSTTLAGIAAALLGAIAALAAIGGDSTINIYWLLILLIGFNCLSILLWLVGITFGMRGLSQGVLTTASGWLVNLLGKRDSPTGAADTAWMQSHLQGAIGKWRYSQFTHGLWLVYLITGLLALLLALSVRQYDFVWGTTLLSNDAFVALTNTIGQPLSALGFATPDSEHVIATRIGSEQSPGAEHRYRWAQLLMGALLLYGILPRVLLLLASRVLLGRAEAGFSPDYYLPYYIRLRQDLMPMHGASVVVDADTVGTPDASEKGTATPAADQTAQVPDTLYWVGVELRACTKWPPGTIDANRVLGHATDTASLETVHAQLRELDSPHIAIAVTAARAPDRGLKRVVLSLRELSSEAWLVLLEPGGDQPTSDARLTDWYQLAEACEIAAGHIVQMSESSGS